MTPRKKIIIITSVFLGLLVVLIIIALIFRQNQSQNTPNTNVDQNSYTDPYSGETVLNPDGKVPESSLKSGDVVILGISKLLDYGVSSNQIDQVRQFLVLYSTEKTVDKQKITEISFISESFKQTINQKSGQKDLRASLKINRSSTQTILLSYVSTRDMLVKIYSSNNKLVYTSPYDE